MPIAEYLRAVLRYWWLLVIAVAVGIVLAVLYSRTLPRLFVAESRLIVGQALYGTATNDVVRIAQQLSSTYASLATTRPVVARAVAGLENDGSIEELRSRVTARAELDSVFVTITARDPSPAHAAAVADGIAREVVALSPLVPVEGSAAATSRLVSIAESAVVPEAPESPRVVLNGLVGAVSGLALALLAVFVREATARVVRAYTPVGSRLGLPILGRLPRDPTKATALPGGTPTGSVDVDVLRRRLDFLALGTDDRVFMVVSPLAGEGRTTVAVALAQCMADSGRRTLLIDADLLRPAVHVRYGLPNLAGLMTGLRASDPREATPTQEVGQRLHVIVAGTPGHTGPMPLVHARIAALTAMVRERYDAVVVDTPAMHESKVATELAPHVDRAILVARVDYSDRPALTEAVRLLSEAGRELTGVVLNDVPTDRLRSALDRLRRPPGSPPAQAARLGR